MDIKFVKWVCNYIEIYITLIEKCFIGQFYATRAMRQDIGDPHSGVRWPAFWGSSTFLIINAMKSNDLHLILFQVLHSELILQMFASYSYFRHLNSILLSNKWKKLHSGGPLHGWNNTIQKRKIIPEVTFVNSKNDIKQKWKV